MAIDPRTRTGEVKGYYIGPRANLRGAKLDHAILTGADLTGADLTGADLSFAHLQEADLTGAILEEANLFCTFLERADLTGAILHRASIIDAQLKDAVLVNTDFSASTIEESKINGSVVNCNFDNARIAGTGGGISESFVWRSSFKGTTFSETYITSCEMLECDFTGAKFFVIPQEGAKQVAPNGFIGCTLNIKINDSHLSHWTFTNCRGSIEAENCEILYCEFLMSDLHGSEFRKNQFKSTKFLECDLERVEFSFVEKAKKSNKKGSPKSLHWLRPSFASRLDEAPFAALALSMQFCNLIHSSFKQLTALALDLFGSDLSYSDFSGARIEALRSTGAQFIGANWSDVEILWGGHTVDVMGGGPGFEDLCPLFISKEDVREYLIDEDRELYIKKFVSNIDAGILASDIDKPEKEIDSFYKELKERAEVRARLVRAGLIKLEEGAEYAEMSSDIRNRVKLKAVEAFPEIFDVLDEQAQIENALHTRTLRAWLKSPVGETGGLYKIANDQRARGKMCIIADFRRANLDGAIFNALKSPGGLCLNKASMKKAELVKCELVFADFIEADLRDAIISDSVINGARCQRADLRGTTIIGSVISANFKDADFKGAKLLGNRFIACDLSGAKNLKEDALARTYLSESTEIPPNFTPSEHVYLRGLKVGPNASLAGADLHGANLIGINLEGADLSGANLEGADLSYVYLLETNLHGANLNRAKLERTRIVESDLSDAKLKKSKIKGTSSKIPLDIRKSDLSHADLSDASMRHVRIAGSDLSHANISGAKADYIDIAQSNASNLNARKMKAREIQLFKNDLTDADFSGSRIEGDFIRNKLKNTSFEGAFLGGPISKSDADLSDRRIEFGGKNKFIKTSFRGATLNEPYFTHVKDLGSSDFRNARIIKPRFGHATDARRVSFENANFLLDKPFEEGESIAPSESSFMSPSLMPPKLREHLKGDIDKHAAARKKAIEADPRYLGMRTGLWIHMTNKPDTSYIGELCVSPYEEGEPIFEERGAYGVIFKGTAPLFNIDVWSEKDRYGGLFPGETPDDWKETFKEGFLDADNSTVARLNILEGFETPYLIQKFKRAGIPVHSVEGSEKAKKRLSKFRPDTATYKKALSKIESRDDSGRIANPSCRVCGQHASLVSRSGAPICEDCY